MDEKLAKMWVVRITETLHTKLVGLPRVKRRLLVEKIRKVLSDATK